MTPQRAVGAGCSLRREGLSCPQERNPVLRHPPPRHLPHTRALTNHQRLARKVLCGWLSVAIETVQRKSLLLW